MKKKVLFLLALIIFIMPLQTIYLNQAQAAVVSKVVSQASKKMAKEIIIDTTINMSFNMVMNYKYTPKADENIKPKTNYQIICLPVDKTGGKCKRPMQLKKGIKKYEIAKTVESSLEKAITGGKGFTRWQKWLDWVIPIYAVSLGATLIDYLFNSDVSTLFDDVAFDSLIQSGLMTPINQGYPTRVPDNTPDFPIIPENGTSYGTSLGAGYSNDFYTFSLPQPLSLAEVNGRYPVPSRMSIYGFEMIFNSAQPLIHSDYSYKFYDKPRSKVVLHGWFNSTGGLDYIDLYGAEYFDTSGKTYIGKIYEMDIQSEGLYTNAHRRNLNKSEINHIMDLLVPFFAGFTISKGVMVPLEDFEMPPTNKPNTKKKVIAPGAFPTIETETGKPVIPVRKPDGTIIYKPKENPDSDRVISPEDITVGDPLQKENPDGSTTVENPNTGDSDDLPPPNKNNPNEEENPPIEDGPSCDTQLKLPRIPLLFRTLSDAFPFSIPFDLKSGFDGIFLNIGSKKPSFNFELNVGDNNHKFDIKIPDFFDRWMPFVHSVLLFGFDVGILYMIYRFIRT